MSAGRRAAACLLALAAACEPERPGGRIALSWTGADTGRLDVPARAAWCAGARLLELVGVGEDSGVALVLYPADTPATGRYPVADPLAADPPRPGAAVAARWFGATTIEGYSSREGEVVVERLAEGTVSGRLRAGLRAPGRPAEVVVEGAFDRVPVVPGTDCPKPPS